MSAALSSLNSFSMKVRHVVALPASTLILATIAVNLLGLAVPIAAQQIFNRVIPSPHSSTLSVLVIVVLIVCALEAVLRLSRALLIASAAASYSVGQIYRLFDTIARSATVPAHIGSAESIEQVANIQRLKDRNSGQLLVGIAELMFLPVVLGLILYISPIAGIIAACIMLLVAVLTLRDTVKLFAISDQSYTTLASRYAFLFGVLEALNQLKSMGVERNIVRRYEAIQSDVASISMKSSLLIGRLTTHLTIFGQLMIVSMLVFGAVAVASSSLSIGAVSAIVLLSGRLLQPLQRAVFIFVQMRDLGKAEQSQEALLGKEPLPTPVSAKVTLSKNEGKIDLEDVSVPPQNGGAALRHLSLSISPGEKISISGDNERSLSSILKVMGGIVPAASGKVVLNGRNIEEYSQTERNKYVAYVSPDARLFNGTIRDNITRFGEASVEQALSVARLMQIDERLNELPLGLETNVVSSSTQTIAPGLRQQIAILRALVLRPRLILFENADRGLDRGSYAALVRFFGRIDGQASIVLLSDDSNLTSQADRHFHLRNGVLSGVEGNQVDRTSYKSLKL